uniref:NADH-ubiquinone oxidoreductase chain 4 n=1 Tax=Cafeteria roenbergensis TaxID=33653 RepID=Q9TAK8_CAFRO|nr:NADH dehydrogenase subunit 4 [Cafeteria roenbergensis]AAF05778.1 NADH dehydrogenase subunit 4 [Cafeteria roenbergensis]
MGTSISFYYCIWLLLKFFESSDIWGLPIEFQIDLILHPSLNYVLPIGVDSLSIWFVILNHLIIYLSLLYTFSTQNKQYGFLYCLLLLQWGIGGAFMVFDLLGFFIFFELTLIPIYLLILIYGSRERKIRASYLISLYTLFGSIFMFFNIFYCFAKFGTTNFFVLMTLDFAPEDAKFLWITFFIAFAAKIPMIPFHIWLPEAHVEAPTIGSVILAALLLKLGTYGILRFLLHLFPEATLYFSPLINVFALISIVFTSMTAIRQIDLKKIIAYSSIGHMNVVLLGMLVPSVESLEGTIFQMLSHGIIAGALFFIVGAFYQRYKVRSLEYFGGFMITAPLLATFFLIFSMANISFPGTSSFIGEFMICFGLFEYNSFAVIIASINMVTGAAYTLWALNRVNFGNLKSQYILSYGDVNRLEFYIFCLLVILMILMGIFPNFILGILHSVSHFLAFTF